MREADHTVKLAPNPFHLLAVGLTDGQSIGELGWVWGMLRTLASRSARESERGLRDATQKQ